MSVQPCFLEVRLEKRTSTLGGNEYVLQCMSMAVGWMQRTNKLCYAMDTMLHTHTATLKK